MVVLELLSYDVLILIERRVFQIVGNVSKGVVFQLH